VLGPEQLNFATRPTPIFLEGVVAVRVSEQMAKTLGLRDNQIIRGVIENRGGLLKLMFKNHEFDWIGSKHFKAGDRIDFRYESSVYGRSLRAIGPSPLPLSSGDTSKSIASASPRLLSLLYRPDQASILTQLFRPGGLESLLKQIPSYPGYQTSSMAMLSADAVKNALLNSGLFGDYFLTSQPQTRPDLKQLLRNLLRNMPLPAATAADIDMAIDEIESRQLDSLQAQQNREASYHFLLPFGDANPVEVHLERRAYQADQEEPDWVINLHTDSEILGELWLKTTLKGSSGLEMIMWIQRADVATMARRASSELEYELQSFGLQLIKLKVLNAPRPSLDSQLSGPGQVVDVRT
jgi:hypothetical protein